MISNTLPMKAWPLLWEVPLKDGCWAVIAPVLPCQHVVPELVGDG